MVDLPPAEGLNSDGANKVARSAVSRLVVPIGLAEVGKTTLIAEIYEKFLAGPFAGYRFAWSSTLHGFEQRAHHARIASGRNIPTTSRTLQTNSEFLHLRLSDLECSARTRDILIADYPGETYRQIRDDVTAAMSYPFIARADHFSFLVDGGEIGNRSKRQKIQQDVEILLQSVLESGLNRAEMSVVYTKWDLATSCSGADDLEKVVDSFEGRIRDLHGSQPGEIHFIKTAARPKVRSAHERGWNLDKVLKLWLDSTRQQVDSEWSIEFESGRESDRFQAQVRIESD